MDGVLQTMCNTIQVSNQLFYIECRTCTQQRTIVCLYTRWHAATPRERFKVERFTSEISLYAAMQQATGDSVKRLTYYSRQARPLNVCVA